MTRSLETRLAKLEERTGVREEERRPSHLLAAYSEAEKAEQIAALIASGKAQESDMFIFLVPLTSDS